MSERKEEDKKWGSLSLKSCWNTDSFLFLSVFHNYLWSALYPLVFNMMATLSARPSPHLSRGYCAALFESRVLTKRDGLLQLKDLITFHFVATL